MLPPNQLIAFRARLDPDRPAVVGGDSVVTFGMLEQAIRATSHRIVGVGLARGTIVALSIDAPGRAMVIGLALERCGLVVAASEPQAAPGNPEFVFSGKPLPAGTNGVVVDDSWFGVVAPAMPPVPPPAELDPCRRFQTPGGSVTLSHAEVARGVRWLVTMLDLAGPADKLLQLHSLASADGYLSTLAALMQGRTVFFPMPGQDPLQLAQVYRCELLLCAAPQLAALTQRQKQRALPVPTLATIAVQGELPPGTRDVARSLIGRRIVSYWGTPSLPLVSLEVAGNQDAPSGAVGYLCPWIDARGEANSGRLQFRCVESPDAEAAWQDAGVSGTITPGGRLLLSQPKPEVQA